MCWLGGGSSPLARGLPRSGGARPGPIRIIPARAGFTAPRRRLARRSSDHPRSRGVYARGHSDAVHPSGSSPLARGLLSGRYRPLRSTRIIPARAGFTSAQWFHVKHVRDHPRSRGVYSAPTSPGPRPRGSSPLARGLHHPRPQQERERRIIPARAGFTQHTNSPLHSPQDHPRSRGVYRPLCRTNQNVSGSSPLARGLLYPHKSVYPITRIIPARAGFTGHHCPHGRPLRDHPRSRGVYSAAPPPSAPQWWIIPARAGFTPVGVHARAAARDHPRSRGVYGWSSTMRPTCRGSSPLARGLPHSAPSNTVQLRIIPARAGFTPATRPEPRRAGDHPRSRGVYALLKAGAYTGNGSSPLARGLHAGRPPQGQGGGIIPARAGFTIHPRGAGSRPADHPRSRGVYCPSRTGPTPARGSSPLARGLPLFDAAAGGDLRIIPARAGFTGRCGRPGALPQDHPRSRGVYPGRLSGPPPTCWIIPARAGFTSRGSPPRSRILDHPRSRGVYARTPPRSPTSTGSSPLARGLPRSRGGAVQHRRIIPARAGFTLANPWNPNEPVVYQTPAAFTADPGPAPPSCGSAVVVPRWTTTPSGA